MTALPTPLGLRLPASTSHCPRGSESTPPNRWEGWQASLPRSSSGPLSGGSCCNGLQLLGRGRHVCPRTPQLPPGPPAADPALRGRLPSPSPHPAPLPGDPGFISQLHQWAPNLQSIARLCQHSRNCQQVPRRGQPTKLSPRHGSPLGLQLCGQGGRPSCTGGAPPPYEGQLPHTPGGLPRWREAPLPPPPLSPGTHAQPRPAWGSDVGPPPDCLNRQLLLVYNKQRGPLHSGRGVSAPGTSRSGRKPLLSFSPSPSGMFRGQVWLFLPLMTAC